VIAVQLPAHHTTLSDKYGWHWTMLQLLPTTTRSLPFKPAVPVSMMGCMHDGMHAIMHKVRQGAQGATVFYERNQIIATAGKRQAGNSRSMFVKSAMAHCKDGKHADAVRMLLPASAQECWRPNTLRGQCPSAGSKEHALLSLRRIYGNVSP
jgi:hypothetical protein